MHADEFKHERNMLTEKMLYEYVISCSLHKCALQRNKPSHLMLNLELFCFIKYNIFYYQRMTFIIILLLLFLIETSTYLSQNFAYFD